MQNSYNSQESSAYSQQEKAGADCLHRMAKFGANIADAYGCYIFLPTWQVYPEQGNTNERDHILKNTHSGGVTVNDWGWHVVNHDAPFGGIGNSGMGTYHGIEGFRELSHAKTVLHRHRFFPTQLFYPPYGTFIQKMILRFFLKKGDPNI